MGLEIDGESPEDVLQEVGRLFVDEFGFATEVEVASDGDVFTMKVHNCVNRSMTDDLGEDAIAAILALYNGAVFLTAETIADDIPLMGDTISDLLTICGAIFIIFGILALLGGVFSIMRKKWGLALVGILWIGRYRFIDGSDRSDIDSNLKVRV